MRVVTAVSAVMVLGCKDPVQVQGDLLQVRRLDDTLELVNRSAQTVYYFAVDADVLALILWAPCSDPATCEGIAAGGIETLAFDEISLYSATTADVVVYHWRLVPANTATGFAPDSIRSVSIRIREPRTP